MPSPDPRTPQRKRTEQILWGTVYGLILACGLLLSYLAMGGPEAIMAQDVRDIRVPPAQRGSPNDAQPDTKAVPAGAPAASPRSTRPLDHDAPADAYADAGNTQPVAFFGIPVE